MEKAYKFRMYPTAKQEELIRKTIGCSRFVYNQTLAARKGAYASGSSIHMTFKESHSGYDCVKLLPGLKDTYPWLREVDSTALQASVLNMDHAYKNFFAGRRGRRKVGFPKFKAKHHSRASYTSKVVGQNIQASDRAVKLPKLGWEQSG